MKLKVCGLNNANNIKEITKFNPDFVGFIFYPGSKRFILDHCLNPEMIKEIPPNIKKVGVFVDASIDEIIKFYYDFDLDYVQLHGNETPAFCAKLFLKQIPVIKTFRLDKDFDFEQLEAYLPFCNYFLFDTKGKLPGGNGVKFSWPVLKSYTLRLPFFLSGGIGPDDINDIQSFNHEMLYAIDVNSKFELSPGIKDIKKVQNFKNQLNQLSYENTSR
ncbi:MAG: phosphoribosylanthranilate isomerase [Bacteroidales bacterium]